MVSFLYPSEIFTATHNTNRLNFLHFGPEVAFSQKANGLNHLQALKERFIPAWGASLRISELQNIFTLYSRQVPFLIVMKLIRTLVFFVGLISVLDAETGKKLVIPLGLSVDEQMYVSKKTTVEVPFVSMSIDVSDYQTETSKRLDQCDISVISLFQAIKKEDSEKVVHLISDSGFKMADKEMLTKSLKKTFFRDNDSNVFLLGKIPLQKGATYLCMRKSKDIVTFSFLTFFQESDSKYRCLAKNPFPILDVLQKSIQGMDVKKIIHDSSEHKIFQEKDVYVSISNEIAKSTSSNINTIKKLIDEASKEFDADKIFTRYSAEKFKENSKDLSNEQLMVYKKSIVDELKDVFACVEIGDVVIGFLRPGSRFGNTIMYFHKTNDSDLKITNLDQSQPIDDFMIGLQKSIDIQKILKDHALL